MTKEKYQEHWNELQAFRPEKALIDKWLKEAKSALIRNLGGYTIYEWSKSKTKVAKPISLSIYDEDGGIKSVHLKEESGLSGPSAIYVTKGAEVNLVLFTKGGKRHRDEGPAAIEIYEGEIILSFWQEGIMQREEKYKKENL